MTKRYAIALFLAVFFILSVAPAQAGILRTLGHAGAKIGRSTCHMVRDVGRDLLEWVY